MYKVLKGKKKPITRNTPSWVGLSLRMKGRETVSQTNVKAFTTTKQDLEEMLKGTSLSRKEKPIIRRNLF